MVVLRACLRGERRLYSLGLGQLQRAVNLVGGDVVEALALVALGQALPIFLRRLQQGQRAYHVGMGEREGVLYRAVDVALRRQVDDAVHVILRHQRLHRPVIADVGLHEGVVLLVLHVLQVRQVAGVGQLIQVDDVVLGVLVHEKAYHVASDEARAARYDDVSLVFHDLSKYAFLNLLNSEILILQVLL